MHTVDDPENFSNSEPHIHVFKYVPLINAWVCEKCGETRTKEWFDKRLQKFPKP